MADIVKIGMEVVGQQKVDKSTKSLNKMEKGAGGAEKSLAKLKTAAKALGAALVIAAAIAKVTDMLAKMGKEALSAADKMGKTAAKLGLTAEELQFFREQAKASGVALEGAEVGFQRFTRRLEQARTGTGALNERFKQLGISLTDQNGNFKSNVEVFKEFGLEVGKIEDSSRAVATVFDAVDTEGVNMINMFRQSEQQMQNNVDRATQFGGVLSNELVAAMEEVNTELGLIESGTKSLELQRDLSLAPLTLGWAEMKNEIAFATVQVLEFFGVIEENANSRAVQQARLRAEMQATAKFLKESPLGTEAVPDPQAGSAAFNFQKFRREELLDLADEVLDLERQIEVDRQAFGEREAERAAVRSAAMRTQMEEQNALRQIERAKLAEAAAAAEATKQSASDRAAAQKAVNKEFEDSFRLLDQIIAADEAAAEQWRLAIDPGRAYALQIEEINRLLRIHELTATEAAAAIKTVEEAQLKMAEETKDPVQDMIDKWLDWETQVKRMKVEGIEGLADSLTDFLVNGEQSFKEFAASFIKQIAAMIVKALIFRAVMAAINAMTGGPVADEGLTVGGPAMPSGIGHADNGGTARPGQPVMIGRGAQPELFVPTTSGQFIPRQQLAGLGGGGGGVNIGTINVTLLEKEDETSDEQAQRFSKQLTRDLEQMVDRRLINQQRSGNILNPAGRTTFR